MPAAAEPKEHSLRRRLQIAAISVVALVVALSAFTQTTRERPPRALAVVDVLGNGRARLMPVAILVDGKFYDANLYRATPRPMSVDQDIIYDVLREGKPLGTFTIGAVSNVSGIWVADGKIKPPAAETAPSEISLGSKSKSTNTSKPAADDEDKPPVLRRPDSKTSAPANTPTNSAPHADNPPPPKTDDSKNTSSADADRPTLKRPASQSTPQSAPPSADTSSSPAPEDEGRPTLKRGKPEAKPEESESAQSATKTNSTGGKTPVAAKGATNTAIAKKGPGKDDQSGQVKETYTAISDASTTEYRPFEYVMSAQDKERFPRDLAGMALEAITRFASTHSTAGTPVAGPLQDVKLAAYDLDLNNTPTVVLTATKPATARGAKASAETMPGLQVYVTVVARTDIYGNIRRLFTHVTDASHVDTIPRLELIDAVDADGTGRGQLLFRQIGENGSRSFILYRVGADQLWPLFEGAAHR
jgi:hypothetical protein